MERNDKLIEFSINKNEPQIAMFIFMNEDRSKSLKIYKMKNYMSEEVKPLIGQISEDYDTNKKIIDNSILLADLKFYNKESVESIVYLLSSIHLSFLEDK